MRSYSVPTSFMLTQPRRGTTSPPRRLMGAAEHPASRHRLRVAPCLLLLALLGAPGCPLEPDGPGDFGRMGQLYIDYLATIDAGVMNICACAVEAGAFDDVDQCWVANGGPAQPPPLAECIAGSLDGQSAAQETLECWLGNQRAYLECLESFACEDDYARYLCEDVFFAPCPALPYEVNAAVTEECFGYSLPPPFYCGDGSAIPDEWVCDGAPDCWDGSDELDCPAPPDSFTCGSGEYVPDSWVCDGYPDCWDGSDEQDCPPPPPSDSFTCGSGESVPSSWVCDGTADCWDGSDEQNCPPPPSDSFTCGSGESVPSSWVCDGASDCVDGSDELDCPVPPDSFMCESGGYVPDSWVCDGYPDCGDGSDELDCPPPFTCESGGSVPGNWVCDGFPDCADGSDEASCESTLAAVLGAREPAEPAAR